MVQSLQSKMQQDKDVHVTQSQPANAPPPAVEGSATEEKKKPSDIETEEINITLVSHQKALQENEWNLAGAMRDLHVWEERFLFDFKIANTPTPALMVERPRSRIELGHYRCGRNGFGLRDEIAISEEHVGKHLVSGEYWRVLGTLLHELLHCHQAHNGRPAKPSSRNYHNVEYRAKAKQYGLIVDARGYTQYAPAPTPFWDLLKQYGVAIPQLSHPIIQQQKRGTSSLRRYVCPCGTKIRSGRMVLRVMCLECKGLFERDA